MVRVKFCGITTLEDAAASIESGADLLGFNFYPRSPRSISPDACRQIVQSLGDVVEQANRPIHLVGVFVNQPPEEVIAILESCALDLAQLSGDEPAEDLQRIGRQAYKAIRLGRETSLEDAIHNARPRSEAPAFLIDASVPGEYGGTGQIADWSRARLAAQYFPLLLAGGLTPDNVGLAVRAVQPWGVDVASGIESAPGQKDPRKMEAFVREVRRTDVPAAVNPGSSPRPGTTVNRSTERIE